MKLSCLLLFRFALLKLFSNKTALQVITSILPRREEYGQSVRDRRTQISRLIIKDTAYQKHYFTVVKKLYPVMRKQLHHLAKVFNLGNLLFHGKTNAQGLYVKLFSETMFEILNSGLGVVVGFRFRPSSRAFQKGYENIRKYLEPVPEESIWPKARAAGAQKAQCTAGT